MELTLDDVTQRRNKKYGYNNTVAVTKAADIGSVSVIFIEHAELSYFAKSGRARISVKRRYSVRVQGQAPGMSKLDRNWITNKAVTVKYYNHLVKGLKNGTIKIDA